MQKFDLCGEWKMAGNGYSCTGTVPGSVYSFLLDNKLMPDPFYRDNEKAAFDLLKHDYTFSRSFVYTLPDNPVWLCMEGLDTLCEIFLNGEKIADTDNMHRTYEFDVTKRLKNGSNEISLTFHSPIEYVRAMQQKKALWSASEGTMGYGWLRKANCMLGWDWGPRLPDAGIWRPIYLLSADSPRITDWQLLQRHENGAVYVTPQVTCTENTEITITLTDAENRVIRLENRVETRIENPKLWWPNGMGEPYLYTLTVCVPGDRITQKIGLRSIRLVREPDAYGESYCHEINGVRFFAMGADYIPEDNILSRITPQRSRTLLQTAKDCHFNVIRIWGGGYYPDEWFFDLCDELGLCVYIDLMFACTQVPDNRAFVENILCELKDNLTRIRRHPCMAVIAGNNEIEQFIEGDFNKPREDYLALFEDIIPKAVAKICPELPYVTSSPTAHGGCEGTWDETVGDCHYWDVWHGGKPFAEYRKHHFRYLSEFGFQSFPDEKTVRAFTLPQERNLFSRIVEMHQRNGGANGKILTYLSASYLYPNDFSTLIYASQLLQAEAMRYGVEHCRRERGRCMGTLYWQLNDIWPAPSWSSIDAFGRWKALQYYAKRFYAPVLLSCDETGENTTRPFVTAEDNIPYCCSVAFGVTNDTLAPFNGEICWSLRDTAGRVLQSESTPVAVAPMSALTTERWVFGELDTAQTFCYYELRDGETVLSNGTVLFCAPKHFDFADPEITAEVCGDTVCVKAGRFAKSVEIYSPDSDFVLEDNFFDMLPGERRLKIVSGAVNTLKVRSVYDIK